MDQPSSRQAGGSLAVRILRPLLIGVGAVWLLWIVAAQAFLATPLLRALVNRRSIRLEYNAAWSIVPFVAHVRGFRLLGLDSGTQWELQIDRATTVIAVHELLHRVFHATHVRAHGVSFALRRRIPVPEWKDRMLTGLARLDGFPAEALKEEGPEDELPDWRYKNFSVWLEGIDASGVRGIWIDHARLTGDGTARGAFFLKPSRDVLVAPGQLSFARAAVAYAGAPLLEADRLELSARLGPFDPREIPPADILRRLDVELSIEGRIRSLAPLFPGVHGGEGPLSIALHVQAGEVLPGSRVRYDPQRLSAREVTAASARIALDVRPPASARLSVAIRDVSLKRAAAARRVDAVVEGAPPDLAQPRLPERVALDVEGGTFDAAALARMFDAPFEVRSGTGAFSARLSGPATRLGGTAHVDLTGAVVRRSGIAVRADAVVDALIAELDPQRGANLAGTSFAVERARLADRGEQDAAPDWWARGTLPRALVRFDRKLLDADLAARCRDARPIVGLYVRRSDLPGFVAGLFAMDNLRVTGSALLTPDSAAVRDLTAQGDGASVRGVWRREESESQGAALLSVAGLSVAVGMGSGGSHVQIFGPGSWFADQEKHLQPGIHVDRLPQARRRASRRRVVAPMRAR